VSSCQHRLVPHFHIMVLSSLAAVGAGGYASLQVWNKCLSSSDTQRAYGACLQLLVDNPELSGPMGALFLPEVKGLLDETVKALAATDTVLVMREVVTQSALDAWQSHGTLSDLSTDMRSLSCCFWHSTSWNAKEAITLMPKMKEAWQRAAVSATDLQVALAQSRFDYSVCCAKLEGIRSVMRIVMDSRTISVEHKIAIWGKFMMIRKKTRRTMRDVHSFAMFLRQRASLRRAAEATDLASQHNHGMQGSQGNQASRVPALTGSFPVDLSMPRTLALMTSSSASEEASAEADFRLHLRHEVLEVLVVNHSRRPARFFQCFESTRFSRSRTARRS